MSRRTQVTIGGSAIQGAGGVAISSDGQVINTSPGNGSVDLWSVMSDGSGQKQLTKNTGKYNSTYQFTSDGSYFIFNSIRSGNNQVWRMNADGSNPIQLSNTGQPAGGAEISPDGKWVYFIESPPGQSINQVNKVSIEGGESILADERNYADLPRFSPDGKLLMFVGKDENNAPLPTTVIESATGKVICPAEKLLNAQYGIWAKDSRHLIYPKSLNQELWQYDIFADKHEKIADFRPATIFPFAISPDGKKFVFSLGNISDETILFTNYLSETK
ncbi:hypothetical protein BH10ACI1_BH10ACI1_31380 [soil metagenome]